MVRRCGVPPPASTVRLRRRRPRGRSSPQAGGGGHRSPGGINSGPSSGPIPPGDPSLRSRSDPVPQPRTARDLVADLHALLHAAAVPGPYVLVGHSLGGVVVRLYASTYPDEVAGLVLVDALPALET